MSKLDPNATIPAGTASIGVVDTELPAAGAPPANNTETISTLSLPTVRAYLYARDANGNINGSMLQTRTGDTDGNNPASFEYLLVQAQNQAFDGTQMTRTRSNAAAVLSGTTQPYALLAAQPGEWTVTHAPAVATQAIASKSAGSAGVRHIATALLISVGANSTAPASNIVTVNLRDGATGAGTILWSITVGVEATAGRTTVIPISGLALVGSAATAMTLETAAATAANTFASVALSGYSTI